MRVLLLAVLALALVLLAASQLALPGIAERRVADRLTERGGEASVSVSAFPAARLLLRDGGRFEVRARGLDLELAERTEVFDRLDGFDEVDVEIDDFTAGPFALDTFVLTRAGPAAPYRMVSRGETVPADVVEFGAGRLGLPGGGILGDLAGEALGDFPVPFAFELELASDEGRIVVVSGGGTVAGLPAGPLARLLTAAIVERL
jgi:hypothetical protein